jgi:uncharacterized protein
MGHLMIRSISMVAQICFAIFISRPTSAQQIEDDKKDTKAKPQSIDELLLFLPSKYPDGDWSPKGLRYDDVFFTATDQTKLHGWYCPVDKPRAVMLMLHGNAGHVASRSQWLKYLQNKANVSVFIFDYRGYGRSEGKLTVEGALLDAQAARSKLCELAKVQSVDLLLMGESLGGAFAVQLASDPKSVPRGLILQSTFSSLREVADVHFPKLAWLVPIDKLNSAAHIDRYRGPLLQSHGTGDKTIPFSLGEKLFSAANEPKQFCPIHHADHDDWLTDSYLKQLDAFIERVSLLKN